MTDFLDLRTAFYPCCGYDIQHPLKILQRFVDRVIFCDVSEKIAHDFKKKPSNLYSKLPTFELKFGPAIDIIKILQRIDVLFYRCDGTGEGGSGVKVLGDNFIKLVLDRMPISGGLIITDGSNTYPKTFEKWIRPKGIEKFGWHLQPHPIHPTIDPPDRRSYCQDGKLHVIQVSPVFGENGPPKHFDLNTIYF